MARYENGEEAVDAASGRNGPPVFLVLLIAVAAVIAIFIAQNRDESRIEFLVFDFDSKVWTAIVISLLLGIVLDRLILMWWRRARRRE